MMCYRRILVTMLCLFTLAKVCQAQQFELFAPEVKAEYPSAVYDFLERYLYEIDSLQQAGVPVNARLRDERVSFQTGTASTARLITKETAFSIRTIEDKYFETIWTDTLGYVVLDLVFPMQYELILGKPKVEIELDFKDALLNAPAFTPIHEIHGELKLQDDGCWMTDPVANYYVESLNTATYYIITNGGQVNPTTNLNADENGQTNVVDIISQILADSASIMTGTIPNVVVDSVSFVGDTVQTVSDEQFTMEIDTIPTIKTDMIPNGNENIISPSEFRKIASADTIPIFSDSDKWHSAANLFLGCIDTISDYKLYIEQSLYGFKKAQYLVPLAKWLAYCQSMKMTVYFGIEEEREDGLKALVIAQCKELGFNHMMSVIIPFNFVNNKKTVFKAKLNAYIPTQNVKNLYQQYVDKPKKKI